MNKKDVSNGTHYPCAGAHINVLPAEKFNRCRISINFIWPAAREWATAEALLPLVLERGYQGCPDMTELSKKLARLYGAALSVDGTMSGQSRVLTVSLSGIRDAFALAGEPLSREYADIAFGTAFEPYRVDGVLDAEAVAIEKEQLRELLEGEINEKRSYCIRQARRRFYGDSPAGIERNGYLDEVDGLTADAVTRAYARMVEQAQIEVFVLGADVDAVAQRLRTALSGLRRAPEELPRPSPCPPKSRAALKNRCPPCRASCACCSHRASPLRRRTFPRCGWPWRCWAVRPPRACSRTCAKSRACAITARRPTLRSPARCVWTAAWSTPTPRRPGSPS